MARKVDHFNGVQCVSSTTNDPFPVLRKAKLPNDDREGGEGGGGGQTRRDCSGELLL